MLVACPQCHSIVRVPEGRTGEAPRCPRCKSQLLTGEPVALDGPAFAAHVERATGLRVAKVNTDEQQQLAARFGIRSIPTLILFRDGRELARQSGAVDAGSLSRWLGRALT